MTGVTVQACTAVITSDVDAEHARLQTVTKH
jgi:hypothetical protein